MTYVDGFVLPVPRGKLDEYLALAKLAGSIWMEHGALQYKECVEDDMSEVDVCKSFPTAFGSEAGEAIIFAFIVYASREDRDRINEAVMADPRLECDPAKMPFDVSRMVCGGFKTIVDM